MNRHKSLVAFTLLIQSAIGSIWCVGITLTQGDTPFRYGWHAASALLFVLAGLCFSVGHLGRPAVGFYAVRNLRRSWLSREIAASVALAASVAVMAFTALRPEGLNGWVVFTASVVGGFVLYAMARAYRLRTVPSWNHGGTLFGFLGSAFLLGGLQFTVVSDALTAVTGAGCNFAGPCLSGYVGLLVALVGFLFRLQAQGPNRPRGKKPGVLFGFSRPVLQGSGIALWVASVMSEYSAGLSWGFLFLAAVFVVVGEIIHRSRFYDSYRSAGL